MEPQKISSQCVARYGSAALPRYTSYPTAPNFTPRVTEADYRRWLHSLDRDDLSIYVHLPFCRSMCWYCGCHTTVARRTDPVARYMRALERELELVAAEISGGARVSHLHFGGGTPTLIEPKQLSLLMRTLRARFDFADGAELAVEIDPRTLTEAMADRLGREGFTRVSLGVQSFDPGVQKAINRIQSFEVVAEAVERLRRSGIREFNFDLIYGLPRQTTRSCVTTVAQALRLQPDRLSVFGYAHVPAFKRHQRKIDSDTLPDTIDRWAQFEAIGKALAAAGFVAVGLDHFARPQDALSQSAAAGKLRRNFQGYTTDTAPALIGLGASAISRARQGYAQNSILISDYQARLDAGHLPIARGYALTVEDRLRGTIIERLMCDYEADVAEICAAFDEDPAGTFPAEQLALLEMDGLIEIDGFRVMVLPDARPLVRSVAATFDAHLAASGGRHARAV